MDRKGVEEALKQILREEQADLRKGLDLTYEQKLDKNDLLRASLGAGRGGVDSGFISYEKEFKKGGKVKKSIKPKVRGHGIEKKGKTKGRFV